MGKKKKIIVFGAILFNFAWFISCDKIFTDESEDSEILEKIEEVSKIAGAEDVTITVNKGIASYFTIQFDGIIPNEVLQNDEREGWCIDWQKPINSNSGVYSGITLYSTYLVEKWKPVNYLLNIIEQLQQEDSEITFREIQLAIWSLRAFPEFRLDDVPIEDLPSRMLVDGEPNFSKEKVESILEKVENGSRSFDFSESTRFAVIVATPAEVQTIIAVVE